MKKLIIGLLLAWPLCYGLVHGQTPPALYQCPDLTREGQTAHLGSECPTWVWSSPNRAYLIASCGAATCSWNSNVRWRRVDAVTATSAVSACTGTVSGRNCSREAWVRKDAAFPELPPPPPPPPPVDCVVGEWSDWQAGEWGQCRNRTQSRTETRTRTVVTPASNGGAACPALTETREVSQACSLSPPCWPHMADVVAGRVRYDTLTTVHPKYTLKATYFCATPSGPAQQTWATSYGEVFRRAVVEQVGTYSEEAAADQCEAECEPLAALPEALRAELAEFAAQFTVEQIGVIE